MSDWRITIRISPFSTHAGMEKDREAAGPEFHKEIVRAESAKEAVAIADLLARAIKLNPRVWQSNVVEVKLLEAGRHS